MTIQTKDLKKTSKVVLSVLGLFLLIRFSAPAFMATGFTESVLSRSSNPTNVTVTARKVKTEKLPIEVLECHDGDTCWVQSSDGWKLKVRFAGMDAPELAARFPGKRWPNQPWGENSFRLIKQDLLQQKIWFVEPVDRDFYGRHIVWIYSSRSENKPQQILWVKKGWAHAITTPKDARFDEELLRGQNQAQQQKRGLWSQNPKDILVPERFRSRFLRNKSFQQPRDGRQ